MRRIVLAGGTGFLGQALAAHFQGTRWDVVVLARSPRQTDGIGRQVAWDARTLGSWQRELDGAIAVVNLTGKSVNCRYTAANRKEILDSRVDSTRVLGQAIAKCRLVPRVWLNASTATIYRHTFDEAWDEHGKIKATPEVKDAFSLEVATAWEQTLSVASNPETRKIAMRIAMVLGSGRNSVFPVLRRLVRFGLGGKMGNGRQYVSWIHEADFCRAVEWMIAHDNLAGPINVTAPSPVPNGEMMQSLRRVCRARLGLPATEAMLEVGAIFLRTETELILKSRRVLPRRLLDSGFKFQFLTINAAFENLCRQKN